MIVLDVNTYSDELAASIEVKKYIIIGVDGVILEF